MLNIADFLTIKGKIGIRLLSFDSSNLLECSLLRDSGVE